MARTKTITDEQILDAAREMFRVHGFAATTAQIAEQAGISEGSIFRRWASKQELMMTALGVTRPRWIDLAETLHTTDQSVEAQLTEITMSMLEFFCENIGKMTAMLSAGTHVRRKFMCAPDAPPVQGLRALANYFAQLRADGRIRVTDPEIAARMLLSATHHYAFSDFAGLNEIMPMPRETYARGIVDNLLRGIGPINE